MTTKTKALKVQGTEREVFGEIRITEEVKLKKVFNHYLHDKHNVHYTEWTITGYVDGKRWFETTTKDESAVVSIAKQIEEKVIKELRHRANTKPKKSLDQQLSDLGFI